MRKSWLSRTSIAPFAIGFILGVVAGLMMPLISPYLAQRRLVAENDRMMSVCIPALEENKRFGALLRLLKAECEAAVAKCAP